MSSPSMSRVKFMGLRTGRSEPVPAGAKSVTFTLDADPAELHYVGSPPDPNRVRLGVEADFGAGFRAMTQPGGGVWTSEWVSGPAATAPSVTWTFDPAHPPLSVRGLVDDRNEMLCGLTVAFA